MFYRLLKAQHIFKPTHGFQQVEQNWQKNDKNICHIQCSRDKNDKLISLFTAHMHIVFR